MGTPATISVGDGSPSGADIHHHHHHPHHRASSHVKMSFFQDCNDFDMGDFEDLMKNINVDDLLRMDTGEAIQDPNTRRIKTDKYRDMLRSQNLFLSPEEVIYSSMATFGNIIQELSAEQQECCRNIRRKGRNKFHALKCRQKKKDEVAELEERVARAQATQYQLQQMNQQLQVERADKYRLLDHEQRTRGLF